MGNAAGLVWYYYREDDYRNAPPGGVLVDPKDPRRGLKKHKFRRMFKGYCIAARDPCMFRVLKRHSRPPLEASCISFRCAKSAVR